MVSFSSEPRVDTAAHSASHSAGGMATVGPSAAAFLSAFFSPFARSSTCTMFARSSVFSEESNCLTTIVPPIGVSSFE